MTRSIPTACIMGYTHSVNVSRQTLGPSQFHQESHSMLGPAWAQQYGAPASFTLTLTPKTVGDPLSPGF